MKDLMLAPIPSWSHSRIVEFEKCKRKIYLMQVDKVPEPERPLPPGKTEHANDRGSRIHDGAEKFVRGQGPLPAEAAKHFRTEMEVLRTLFEQGRVSLEGEWGMNQEWEPTGWRGAWREVPASNLTAGASVKTVKALPDYGKPGDIIKFAKQFMVWIPAWLRLKLDALVHISKYEAIAIDYKTGKKFGNELKHAEQLQLYQLVTFLRYPQLEEVTTELWYFDVDDLTSGTYTRSQGLRFQRSWNTRGSRLTTCTDFPANPNIFSCKWCGYGPDGTGHCAVGYTAFSRNRK